MNINDIITESQHACPHCGGPLVEYSDLMEKKDACYYKVKAGAKVWPSAYASGRLVQCRKKGAANWGNKSEGVAEGDRPGMKDGRPYSDPLRRHPGNDSYMTPEYLIQKYQDELKKIAAGPYKRPKDVAMYQARIAKLQRQQGLAEGSLKEFAIPGGSDGDSERWYTDSELADIIGDDWFEDFDVSNDGFNIDAYGEKAKKNLVGYANAWFNDKGYNVDVMGVEHNDVDHDLQWYIVGSFHNPRFANEGVAEAQLNEKCWDGYQQQGMKNKSGRQVPNCVPVEEELTMEQQFDLIEDMVESLAQAHGVDSEQIWEDFESVDDHELFETAAWRRKEGKSAKGGLNAKGVASYRRENPGSKLQMAVTTKPSKLKPGSKAAKRRKSFCARMGGVKGPMKKPNGKPTRKALALRKWNC